jgi:hypothetical protein
MLELFVALSIEKPILCVDVRQLRWLQDSREMLGLSLRAVFGAPGGEYSDTWLYYADRTETLAFAALENSFALDRREREQEATLDEPVTTDELDAEGPVL